jgi:streptogrisin C
MALGLTVGKSIGRSLLAAALLAAPALPSYALPSYAPPSYALAQATLPASLLLPAAQPPLAEPAIAQPAPVGTMTAPPPVAAPAAPAAAGLPMTPPGSAGPRVQSAIEALAQDAREYAAQNGVALDEAMRRLRAQEESVAATDRIRDTYTDRLAGIAIEHQPDYRIVVLLTGDDPVAPQSIIAGGMRVPIVFRTGAAATGTAIIAAMRAHQAKIRSLLPSAGMGLDPRTGELVVIAKDDDIAEMGTLAEVDAALEGLTGVPVRVQPTYRKQVDLGIEGGSRVVGAFESSGRRYACTTGFVVTDGARTGIVTAAHCPDTLTYFDPDGGTTELDFIGEWGARYQDVQINVSPAAQKPLFYAASDKRSVRTLTSWRNRSSTRAGDAVCHRGETTGYSCSQVELTDYAPPRDLCGGPCEPLWVTVKGPACRSGDSGGPIFNATIAFGIVKGGSYERDGTCSFYYYMSTDYLPAGWSLLHG